MLPGSIYLGMVAGQSIGPAARWVTIILFLEVAKRSRQTMRQQEIFTLYYMAGMVVSTPFSGLLWNQYLVVSEAATSFDIAAQIPHWVAPPAEVIAREGRTFFSAPWTPVIALIIFTQIIQRIDHFGLGYVLYRVTAHAERLPFPMAPVAALGSVALAEASQDKTTWRWNCFSVGSVLGMAFGGVYVGLPAVTGALWGKPVILIPIPWLDWTQKTEQLLPAVATGLVFDLGVMLVGMVLPFWAVVGGFAGVIITFIANPILHHAGVLHTWQPGMDTVDTLFANTLDFYLSFGIGLMAAIAVIGFYQAFRSYQRSRDQSGPSEGGSWRTLLSRNRERGDVSIWIGLGIYGFSTGSYILLCCYLLDDFPWIFFLAYALLYTPLMSYASARMEGLVGQVITIPMVREASFILSGYKGVDIWFAPIPIHDYGATTVGFRQIELTGTRLTSIIKTELLLFPIVIVSGLMFSELIWRMAPVPSASYPFAQKMWDLQARNSVLLMTSTVEGYSPFLEALRFEHIASGFVLATVMYALLSAFGLPILLVYGLVRGLGQSMPHAATMELVGALIGRFYFLNRFGPSWRQYAPVLLAGFSCGMGLVGMLSVAIALILKSAGAVGV